MIGFLSLSSSFLVFEFFSLLLLKALELLNETTKTKEGGERESFALSLCREKISLKISHKGQKRRKKASFQGRKYSLSVLSV